ncbi:hypothetical protein B9G55_11150 [Saccharibacillus sp. O16]|nr:hypothetical protein B9G55_11150 [Saccharibacillus sp. O16]
MNRKRHRIWLSMLLATSFVLPFTASAPVQAAQFQYPYVVGKMSGLSLAQSRDYYKVLNVSTKKLYILRFPQNVKTAFVTKDNRLVVNTSSIPGTLGGPVNEPQTIYGEYLMETGKVSKQIQRTFTQPDSNWSSSDFGNRLLLTDLERGTQSLLTQGDQVIAERTTDRNGLGDRLVGYSQTGAWVLTSLGKQSAQLMSIFES